YDGKCAKIFQDGNLVAQCDVVSNPVSWKGPLIIGQYTGESAPAFQFKGVIENLKVFQYSFVP
ncbi:MAG: hypothetical protein ACRCUY_02090, partial [Thermoguttaceae bacterium]